MKELLLSIDDKEICAICLEIIESDSINLQCNHNFHIICIDKWKSKENTCPICRKPIDEVDFVSDESESSSENDESNLSNEIIRERINVGEFVWSCFKVVRIFSVGLGLIILIRYLEH